MPAICLDALERRPGLGWKLPVDAVDQQLGEAEHRIERCAEFVAHISQELGLVTTGRFQLAALLLQLAKQFCILYGQH